MFKYARAALEPSFLKRVFVIAMPIAVQLFVASAVNLVDVIMIGFLGDGAVAAAGAANQIFFLLNLALFGITSGASVFLSQFWGSRDVENIQRTTGMMFLLGTLLTAIFTVGALVIPDLLVQMYVHDPSVIALGADYLWIVGFSYPFTAISIIFSTVCRCTGNVKLPMVTSILSVVFNTCGNALLIFGLLGFPALGLRGAAIATLIARILECAILLVSIYRHHLPSAIRPRQMLSLNVPFVKNYLRTTLPVVANEVCWSIGTSLYSVAYGLMGTNAVAAVQIANTVIQLFFVFNRGISNACSIIIGQRIGAGDEAGAIEDSRRFFVLMPLVGVILCLMVFAATPFTLALYSVSPETLAYAGQLMRLQGLVFVVRSLSIGLVVGILRSGGDTVFAAIADIGSVWIIGVPMAFLGVKLGLPLWGVFLCVSSEELIKVLFCLPRFFSNKWVRNVVSQLQSPAEPALSESCSEK